jgi:hypothetical protein
LKFWDASALVPLFVEEDTTAAMTTIALSDSARAVWWGTPIECISALERRLRSQQIDQARHAIATTRLADARRDWVEIEPTVQLRAEAARLLRSYPLRAGDAFQLAAAINAQNGMGISVNFVCLDERLCQAARGEGFTVEP